ncbi:MAG: CDP-diacylglycerol--glycerol-3-phosphate 3-phosphatidyltransferase [Candidatus Omnitrophica bacterium]|nr:CDP-diacylglycerol--glycerol-3-phosphate 3-phosphatidyltransferase [Candidatus Omnitrophota bacterium]
MPVLSVRLRRSIPNMLTVIRILGVVLATYVLFKGTFCLTITAIVLYAMVTLTDLLDGYLARKWDAVSAFGALMDPIADKVYILTLYASFVFLRLIAHWWIWPIFIREVTVTVVRLIMVRRGLVIAAERGGKIKTFMQNISVFSLFLYYVSIRFYNIEEGILFSVLTMLAYGFLTAAVYLTIRSGFDFFRNNWDTINGNDPREGAAVS